MGWWNWLLGLLHFLCSPIDEASTASTGMVSIHCEPQREKVCVFRVYETVSFPFVFLLVSFPFVFFLKKKIHIKIGVESDGILFSFSCFTGFVRWAMVCLLVGIVGICHHQSTSKSMREGSLESVFQ
jgi:hypothetical protein